jgi:hypothetical protein
MTCNYKNRIIEPLHSRCTGIDFTVPTAEKAAVASAMMKRVEYILAQEKIPYDKTVIVNLVKKHFPDLRRIINELQRYASAGSIDIGVLGQGSSESYKELLGFMKNKDFNEIKNSITTLKSQQVGNNVSMPIKKKFDKILKTYKNNILFESLITANGASHFLEITGGMLTSYSDNGKVNFEVFEASEALSAGDVLSLEEKFLAGQGQNITPARYSNNPSENKKISSYVKQELGKAAAVLNIEGYARIDAFVRIFNPDKIEVIFIEVNSLPGMTPATCIFHQAAIAHYKPYEFIDKILDFGTVRTKTQPARLAK